MKNKLLVLAAFCSLFTVNHRVCAEIWTQTGAPTGGWGAVACSADGTRLIAAGPYTSTYVSTNSGATWTLSLPLGQGNVLSSTNGMKFYCLHWGIQASSDSGDSWQTLPTPAENFQAIACSGDGSKLVAAASSDPDGNPGPICRSVDSGATWTVLNADSNVWSAIASSADGTRLVAAADSDTDFDYTGGPIYYSTDSGTNWSLSDAPAYTWTAIAASADGTKLIAVSRDDGAFNTVPVYLSTNSGAHWFAANMDSNQWSGAALSADGAKLIAVGGVVVGYDIISSVIYTSTNFGSTWSFTTAPAGANGGPGLLAVASSADGGKHFAASYVAGIYTDAAPTPWTKTSAPGTNFWSCVASSADGSKLVAAVHGVTNEIDVCGPVYRSTDAGANWQLTSAPIGCWNSLASSADGTHLTVAESGWVYGSADSGLTWRTNNLPVEAWTSVASSSNGDRLVAISAGGYSPGVQGLICTSTDAGSNWIQSATAPNALWNSVACSADGTRLAATIGSTVGSFGLPGPGMIFTSPDFGATWNLMNAPQALWSAIASSADGTRLIAAPSQDANRNGLPIYTSTNSGVTWITNNTPADHWVSVCSSADGTRLVATTTGGAMYVSTNSGAEWSASGTPYQQWQFVAWSANGNQLVGVVNYGGIYTLQSAVSAASPVLNVSLSGNQVLLAWLTNGAAGFQLQQNTNLATTNWTAVGTVPTVTNLLYQVIVSPTNPQDFYRLQGNH